ncbi:MAG TPA: hypothetical protein VMF05_00610 [Stellaceae bacterium]|nr:hypothetical protein [Stellaceae bacterium]
MRVLFSFAPLILFPFVAGFYSVEAGLWVATAAAILAVVGDRLLYRHTVKILDAGQLLLFGILALGAIVLRHLPDISWIRLIINAGLLAIVLVSIAAAAPFSLQYAREQTPQSLWNSQHFIATNFRISWGWAAAFAVSTAADLARLFVPAIPHIAESGAGIAALVLAGAFTGWYPKYVRAAASTRTQ